MIEFFSLLLGLTNSVHTVELVVIEPVAEVELQLDGRSVGTLAGEPWDLDCDLGEALAPHQLVAIGRDAEGRELERIGTWINFTTFDDDRRYDLSPVAIKLQPGVKLPPAGEMSPWFLAHGEPVEVVAVEPEQAEVVIVRDTAAQPMLDAIADSFYDQAYAFLRPTFKGAPPELTTRPEGWINLDPDVASPYRTRILKTAQNDLRNAGRLGPGVDLRFLSPWAAPVSHVQSDRALFAVSDRIAAGRPRGGQGPTRGFLETTTSIPSLTFAYRLADAVALAASEVHGANRRRAVVVLLGDETEDESQFTPSQVRAYLQQLQVPLFVWSTTSAEPHPEWGEVAYLGYGLKSDPSRWADAFEEATLDLQRNLALQRIVWLKGQHLPQSISLSETARGLSLAGSP